MRNDRVRELLRERETPTRFMYLFEAFVDLCRVRRAGFAAPEPIGLDQIYYWQKTIGIPLQRWEIDVLYRLDALWREHIATPDKPKPTRKV
jgi:hypothetical protein